MKPTTDFPETAQERGAGSADGEDHIADASKMVPVLEWSGCYSGNWRGLITPEAFSHPAKFAPNLIRRIFQHGIERGYWKAGDVIGDPFGGIGGGGVIAPSFGLRWVGVELEPKFHTLALANFDLHRPAWRACGKPEPVILQGDSREFARLVGGVAGCVTSPPFVTQETGGGLAKPDAVYGPDGTRFGRNHGYQNQAFSDGNIASLRPGDLAAVVTSPPYAESLHVGEDRENDERRRKEKGLGSRWLYGRDSNNGYGVTPGQIGRLSAGEIDAVVTSPPYAAQVHGGNGIDVGKMNKYPGRNSQALAGNYGDTSGQIGGRSLETYWQAMRSVYAECFKAIRPGGVLACVVKDYVKDKARVPLCDQTLALLVHCGFEPLERARAMLVEHTEEDGLFGVVTSKKERKSFFRRLCESKGSPHIDWEEVLFVRKGGAT